MLRKKDFFPSVFCGIDVSFLISEKERDDIEHLIMVLEVTKFNGNHLEQILKYYFYFIDDENEALRD